MRLLFRIRSFQTHIALAFVAVILLTILIMGVTSYYLSRESVQSNAQSYTAEIVKQVNKNINSYVNGMTYMSDLVANNRTVVEYLSSSSFSSLAEEKKQKETITDFLESMLVSRTDIASVNIIGNGDKLLTGRQDLDWNPYVDLRAMKWYTDAIAAHGENVISSSHVQPIFKDRYPWVVSLSRELIGRDGQSLGVFLVDLNFSVMNDILKDIKLGHRGYVFIVDQNGRLVYHPQQQLIYSNLKSEMIGKVLEAKNGTFTSNEGGDSRMYTVQDSDFGWKIVGVSYVNELAQNQENLKLGFLALALMCIVLAAMIAIYLTQRVSRPIRQLERHMKEVERGNFDIHVQVPRTIEIGRLARAFNLMVGKIKELMNQIILDQEQKRQSEINALQAQINPHFLYNTLDSIVWMAESNKNREVIAMTSALAKLFRASISKGEELVPVKNEIEHITNYLRIQQMRYSDKLDYSIDIGDSAQHFYTIKVILQPIVENAIYHGIKKKKGMGFITITSEETENDLMLVVEDNGIGMDEETVRTLLLPTAIRKEGRGVGVRNVHERLQLYFGLQYGLSYSSRPGAGTKVTITLPKTSNPLEQGE
ncbi:sensor histidine kinase [Cohnella sp. AR92]|uniref:sensor histidine kinase n=1 Tax=Cohnella sp. AR92 TaxID=648716 RepID=UPI000F8C4AD4|nr:sensor histidine kinase [Cohnella sp. AR92]RUS43545.1 sensor histidine kinase [Cohnella sp. AR92]